MAIEEILKTSATVAGIKSDRQILGLTLQVAAHDANGAAKRLTADNIETIRTSVASIAQLIGVDVEVFLNVFDIPPVELNDGATLRLEHRTEVIKSTPETVIVTDDIGAETAVAAEFV